MTRSMDVSILVLALVAFSSLYACSDDNPSAGGDADVARGDGGGDTPGIDTLLDQAQPDVSTDRPVSDSTIPCGDVTFQGECDGTRVRYCLDGALQDFDCVGFTNDPDGDGVCEDISTDFGFFCAASPGDACLFADADGRPVIDLCSGTEPGCRVLPDATTCVEDIGTCSDADIGACLDGSDLLIFACKVVQPGVIDCAAVGGSCDDSGDTGVCVDVEEGRGCGILYDCADGLDCVGATAQNLGTCTADSGDNDIDAGNDAGTDAGTDAGADTGSDAGSDTGGDTGDNTGGDTGDDAGGDTGDDAGGDTGNDTGADTGNDLGSDAGSDADTD